jgi:hypothetical protein
MGACVKVTVPVLFVNTCMSIKLQTAASSVFCSFAYGCVEDFKLPNRIMMPSAVVYRAVQHKKRKNYTKVHNGVSRLQRREAGIAMIKDMAHTTSPNVFHLLHNVEFVFLMPPTLEPSACVHVCFTTIEHVHCVPL